MTVCSRLWRARIEQRGLLLIAGLGGKYSSDTHQNIPALWQRLQPHLGNVLGKFLREAAAKEGGRLASATTSTMTVTSTISPV